MSTTVGFPTVSTTSMMSVCIMGVVIMIVIVMVIPIAGMVVIIILVVVVVVVIVVSSTIESSITVIVWVPIVVIRIIRSVGPVITPVIGLRLKKWIWRYYIDRPSSYIVMIRVVIVVMIWRIVVNIWLQRG